MPAHMQLSRLVSETQPLGTVSYEYDAAGRRTKLTYPGSYYLDYDWSVAGDLLKIRENGASSGVGVLASYAYDNLGRRASLTRGNGNVTTYGFDAASRLNALDLDLDGATTTNDLAFDFAHNPASQIIDEDSANGAYDWTEPAAFTDNYTVNYLNQYLTAAGATITHDGRGNIASDGTTSFTYDAMNRLTSVSGGASAALAYDPASRLYEVDGTATTRFLYDPGSGSGAGGADIIAEYEPGSGSGSGGEDALLRRYVHGPGADEALVWLEGTDTSDRRFLIADTRGSIVAIADATGATTNKNLYDAYGTPHAANAGRFQYTGQIWLAEAGLYHYKARAYSPMLGRFLQTDPIGYGDGMNMYAYAGNDPVNFTDPSGLSSECPGILLDNGECVEDIISVEAQRNVGAAQAERLWRADWDSIFSQPYQTVYFYGSGRGKHGYGEDEDEEEDKQPPCDQALIDSGNRQVALSNTLARYAGYVIAVGAGVAFTGAVLATAGISTPLAALGLGAVSLASVATSGAALLRVNGGVLQGRGGGGYQNVRQGLLALVVGNTTRLASIATRVVTRAASTAERAVAETLAGGLSNLALQIAPGEPATCGAP